MIVEGCDIPPYVVDAVQHGIDQGVKDGGISTQSVIDHAFAHIEHLDNIPKGKRNDVAIRLADRLLQRNRKGGLIRATRQGRITFWHSARGAN